MKALITSEVFCARWLEIIQCGPCFKLLQYNGVSDGAQEGLSTIPAAVKSATVSVQLMGGLNPELRDLLPKGIDTSASFNIQVILSWQLVEQQAMHPSHPAHSPFI